MSLLTPNDPDPFTIFNGESEHPLIITVEHAFNHIPEKLRKLGLNDDSLDDHIAYDAHAFEMAHDLAERLNCPMVVCNYSRLVIDCNRLRTSDTIVKAESDGVVIPGNQALSPTDIEERLQAIYDPFHAAVESIRQRRTDHKRGCAILSMHSFTPQMASAPDESRPWDIGLLWDQDDDKMAAALNHRYANEHPFLHVSYNVPYDLRKVDPGSLHVQAYPYNIPAVEIELNQESCDDPEKYGRILAGFVDEFKDPANLLKLTKVKTHKPGSVPG